MQCLHDISLLQRRCHALFAGSMSLGSITDLLSEVPRPIDLGFGQLLLQTRGPGELFFGETPQTPCSQAESSHPKHIYCDMDVGLRSVCISSALLSAGLAGAARKDVGGSSNGRKAVHRARGHVLAYETSTEQVCAGTTKVHAVLHT